MRLRLDRYVFGGVGFSMCAVREDMAVFCGGSMAAQEKVNAWNER